MSTFTTNKNLEQPAAGSYNNTWATPVNADWGAIDNAFGGNTSISVTGVGAGIYTLSVAQYQPPSIEFTGTLTANLIYALPSGVGGSWSVWNNTTGAFSLTFASGSGGSVLVRQGQRVYLICDSVNMQYAQTVGTQSANPSNPIGLNAVNGTFATFMTSDSAPPLDQSIAPTWTGIHTFDNTANFNAAISIGAGANVTGGLVATGATVTVATQSGSDNSTKAASTAFVATNFAKLASAALTGVPTAPTAAVGTNTTQLATTAFASGIFSLVQDGYARLPCGLIIQWGIDNIASGGGTTINFVANGNIAFPNAAFIGVCSAASSGAIANVVSVSATGITMINTSNNQAVSWIALGY